MQLRFNLTMPSLQGAYFADASALALYRSEAELYERVVAGFEAGELDPAEFWKALAGLDFDYSGIQWHIDNPGKRMRQGYR